MSQSTLPLKGKWIVITRPAHQAKSLQLNLEKSGAHVILFPLLEISPPDNIALAKQQLQNLAEYNLIIFISPNAVEQCMNWVKPAHLHSLSIASVGAKTTEALKKYGVEANITPQSIFSSEALLALPEIKKLGTDKKIAILRGQDGRDFLKQGLEQQGCEVDYMNLYRRTCPQNTLNPLKESAEKNQLDIILITSGTSIEHLFSLQEKTSDNNWLNETSLLVGSERIKQQVLSSTLHRGEVLSTVNPSDENLYEKLLEWSKNR